MILNRFHLLSILILCLTRHPFSLVYLLFCETYLSMSALDLGTPLLIFSGSSAIVFSQNEFSLETEPVVLVSHSLWVACPSEAPSLCLSFHFWFLWARYYWWSLRLKRLQTSCYFWLETFRPLWRVSEWGLLALSSFSGICQFQALFLFDLSPLPSFSDLFHSSSTRTLPVAIGSASGVWVVWPYFDRSCIHPSL